MRFLTVVDVVEINGRIISAAGGAFAVRDSGALQSAVAQARARKIEPPEHAASATTAS